jgi:hypothetical protein
VAWHPQRPTLSTAAPPARSVIHSPFADPTTCNQQRGAQGKPPDPRNKRLGIWCALWCPCVSLLPPWTLTTSPLLQPKETTIAAARPEHINRRAVPLFTIRLLAVHHPQALRRSNTNTHNNRTANLLRLHQLLPDPNTPTPLRDSRFPSQARPCARTHPPGLGTRPGTTDSRGWVGGAKVKSRRGHLSIPSSWSQTGSAYFFPCPGYL